MTRARVVGAFGRFTVPGAAAGLVLAVAFPAAAQQDGPYYGPHMWGGAWHGWWVGPLMMLVLIAAVAAIVVVVLRFFGREDYRNSPPRAAGGPTDEPLEILRRRLASGEIDKDEFLERRRLLQE